MFFQGSQGKMVEVPFLQRNSVVISHEYFDAIHVDTKDVESVRRTPGLQEKQHVKYERYSVAYDVSLYLQNIKLSVCV